MGSRLFYLAVSSDIFLGYYYVNVKNLANDITICLRLGLESGTTFVALVGVVSF